MDHPLCGGCSCLSSHQLPANAHPQHPCKLLLLSKQKAVNVCMFINVDTSISAICVNDVVFGRLALGKDCMFEIIHLEMSFWAEPPELWWTGVRVCGEERRAQWVWCSGCGREEAPGPGDLLRVGADAEVGSEVTCSEFGQIWRQWPEETCLCLECWRRDDVVTSVHSGNQALLSIRRRWRKTAAPHTFPFSTEQSMFHFLFSFNPEERLGIFCSQLLYKYQFI